MWISARLLSLILHYHTSYIHVPPTPRSVREKALVRMKALEHPLSFSDLGEFFIKGITPTRVEADKIEEATRRQFACKRWHEERFAKITSSKYGEICNHLTCVQECYIQTHLLSPHHLCFGVGITNRRQEVSMQKHCQKGGVYKNVGCTYPQVKAIWVPLLMAWFFMESKYVAVSR